MEVSSCWETTNAMHTVTVITFFTVSLISMSFSSSVFFVLVRSARRLRAQLDHDDDEEHQLHDQDDLPRPHRESQRSGEGESSDLRRHLSHLYEALPNEVYLKEELVAEATSLLRRPSSSTTRVSFKCMSDTASARSQSMATTPTNTQSEWSPSKRRRESEVVVEQLNRVLFTVSDGSDAVSEVGDLASVEDVETSSISSGARARVKKMSAMMSRRRKTSPDIVTQWTLANAYLRKPSVGSRDTMERFGSHESLGSVGAVNPIRSTGSKSLSRIVVEGRLMQRLKKIEKENKEEEENMSHKATETNLETKLRRPSTLLVTRKAYRPQ